MATCPPPGHECPHMAQSPTRSLRLSSSKSLPNRLPKISHPTLIPEAFHHSSKRGTQGETGSSSYSPCVFLSLNRKAVTALQGLHLKSGLRAFGGRDGTRQDLEARACPGQDTASLQKWRGHQWDPPYSQGSLGLLIPESSSDTISNQLPSEHSRTTVHKWTFTKLFLVIQKEIKDLILVQPDSQQSPVATRRVARTHPASDPHTRVMAMQPFFPSTNCKAVRRMASGWVFPPRPRTGSLAEIHRGGCSSTEAHVPLSMPLKFVT
jgi:hypothetical protein